MAWKLVNPNITNDPSYLEPQVNDIDSRVTNNTTSLAENTSQITQNTNQFKNTNLTHKGVSLTISDAYNVDSWYDTNFPTIKSLNAEIVAITACTVQSATDANPVNDSNIADKMTRLFAKASQYGVTVSMLKPHIMLPSYNDGFNRGTYNPSSISTFFTNWTSLIQYYAGVCQSNNVPYLCITCETTLLYANTYYSNWQTLINTIKQQYPNVQLTMAFKFSDFVVELANYENGAQSVCSLLDVLGFNMYPSLVRSALKESVYNDGFQLTNQYVSIGNETFLSNGYQYGYISAIVKGKRYYGKDVMVTETGSTFYSNSSSTTINPLASSGTNDNIDQNTFLDTVLNVLTQVDSLKGVYVWSINSPFSFLGTNSANTIKKWFGGGQ